MVPGSGSGFLYSPAEQATESKKEGRIIQAENTPGAVSEETMDGATLAERDPTWYENRPLPKFKKKVRKRG